MIILHFLIFRINCSCLILAIYTQKADIGEIYLNENEPLFWGECLIQMNNMLSINYEFIRIKVLGEYNSGKTSLLSALTYDQLDDGEGLARLNLFKHQHEVETGDTSSVTKVSLGFDNDVF